MKLNEQKRNDNNSIKKKSPNENKKLKTKLN